jgi:Uma2 family endonuclease
MTSLLADSGLTWADVLKTWNELEVPEGWRPEITPEGIIMTPPPGGSHNLIADSLHRALVFAVDDEFGVFQSLAVAVRFVGGIFIPDLCVVARERVPLGTEPVDAAHVALAVEITSRSNAAHDRKRKRWAYAHGGVAQYLLVDAFDEDGPAVYLFSHPSDGMYRTIERTPFGHKVTVAPPVATVLDSGLFPSS